MEKKDSQFTRQLAQHRKRQFEDLISDRRLRENNFVSGEANKIVPSKMKPVYPFRTQAVNPYTGEYVIRPGTRQEGVIDLDRPLSDQILEYKRRVVRNSQNVARPNAVIGDPSVFQSRLESNKERMEVLFDDTIRPFLNRQTRVSPIYKDVPVEQRTPRTPLPSDTASMVSPTAGVLHAYRLHWVRMYLHRKKKNQVWDEMIPFENVYDFDSNIRKIHQAANQDAIQEFMHYCKGVAAARNSNFVPTDTVAYLGGIKKFLPLVAKVNTVEIVRIRRRKK